MFLQLLQFQPAAILLCNLLSGFSKPLLECYTKLRERGGVINLKLSESWLRNYQVRIQNQGNSGEQNIPWKQGGGGWTDWNNV